MLSPRGRGTGSAGQVARLRVAARGGRSVVPGGVVHRPGKPKARRKSVCGSAGVERKSRPAGEAADQVQNQVWGWLGLLLGPPASWRGADADHVTCRCRTMQARPLNLSQPQPSGGDARGQELRWKPCPRTSGPSSLCGCFPSIPHRTRAHFSHTCTPPLNDCSSNLMFWNSNRWSRGGDLPLVTEGRLGVQRGQPSKRVGGDRKPR